MPVVQREVLLTSQMASEWSKKTEPIAVPSLEHFCHLYFMLFLALECSLEQEQFICDIMESYLLCTNTWDAWHVRAQLLAHARPTMPWVSLHKNTC